MKRVRLFLRTELFAVRGALQHVPMGAAIVEGTLQDNVASGFLVACTAWFDAQGRALEGGAATLLIPTAKVDHIHVLD